MAAGTRRDLNLGLPSSERGRYGRVGGRAGVMSDIEADPDAGCTTHLDEIRDDNDEETQMSPTARTIQLFGVYLAAVGLVLVAAPNLLLTGLGLPPTDEPWIRVLGVVAGALGVYCLVAARHELTAFFSVTVPVRMVAGTALIAIAIIWGYWAVIAFGLVDIAAATWTWSAQRRAPTGTRQAANRNIR